LLTSFPHLFLLIWIFGGGAGMMLGFMAQGQLLFVSRETTLANVMKGRLPSVAPSSRKQMKNMITFLRTGQYQVIYPKYQEKKKTSAAACCSGHACNSDSKQNDESHKQIASLFSRIEKEIGSDAPTAAAIDSKLNLSLSATVTKSSQSIHSDPTAATGVVGDQQQQRERQLARQQQQQREQHEHKHERDYRRDTVDPSDWDDFDSEFADSHFNNYVGADDEDDFDHNNAYYDQENDEESLLKSRKV
jgi:hypothetical protein